MELVFKQYIFLKTIGLKGWEIAKFVSSGHTVWETEASTNGRGQTWSWINTEELKNTGLPKALNFPEIQRKIEVSLTKMYRPDIEWLKLLSIIIIIYLMMSIFESDLFNNKTSRFLLQF